MEVEVEPLRLNRGTKRVCVRCKHFFRYSNIGECRKFGFEVGMELAKKARVCEDFELHHALPKGNLTPTKRKGEAEK